MHGCIAERFRRPEPRHRVLGYLHGLSSPVQRENGWQLAERTGDATPDGVQCLLSSYRRDADLVRDYSGGLGIGLVPTETATSGQRPALPLSTPSEAPSIRCSTVILGNPMLYDGTS